MLFGAGSEAEAAPLLKEANQTLDELEQLLQLSRCDAVMTIRLADAHGTPLEKGMVALLPAKDDAQERLRRLRRETARAAVTERFPDAPPWAREGLAGWFEAGPPSGQVNAAAMALLRTEAEDGAEGTLSDLVTASAGKTLDAVGAARAWALTHFLLTQIEDGPSSLRNYLENAKAGRQALEPFARSFGATPGELEPAWRLHLGRLAAPETKGE